MPRDRTRVPGGPLSPALPTNKKTTTTVVAATWKALLHISALPQLNQRDTAWLASTNYGTRVPWCPSIFFFVSNRRRSDGRGVLPYLRVVSTKPEQQRVGSGNEGPTSKLLARRRHASLQRKRFPPTDVEVLCWSRGRFAQTGVERRSAEGVGKGRSLPTTDVGALGVAHPRISSFL